MKKTIAIVTFSHSNKNYGQILQAYSLQHYLDSCGHNAYIVDYYAGALERMRPTNEKFSYVKWVVKHFPLLKQFSIRKRMRYEARENSDTRHFAEFRERYIKYSARQYKTFNELKKHPPFADVYVTGSDQTLGRCVTNSLVYMLGFVESSKKKISYAASFGRKELRPYEMKDYRKYLSEYSAIGVREDSGVKICESLGIDNSLYVPDPTILLPPSTWREISSGSSPFLTKKKKLLIYNCYQPLDAFASKFYVMDGVEVVLASVGGPDATSDKISELSIESWIAAIDDADYVITNSFHATMFSLYMNTPFIVFGYTGGGSAMNARLESILPMVGLEERFKSLSENQAEVIQTLEKTIDWEEVNSKLSEMRSVGVDFLKKNI